LPAEPSPVIPAKAGIPLLLLRAAGTKNEEAGFPLSRG